MKAHRWREVGRMPVTLVQHACDCGCKRRRVTIVAPNGRGVAISLPELGGLAPAHAHQLKRAITVGRELLSLWERAKALAGAG